MMAFHLDIDRYLEYGIMDGIKWLNQLAQMQSRNVLDSVSNLNCSPFGGSVLLWTPDLKVELFEVSRGRDEEFQQHHLHCHHQDKEA